VSIFCDAAPGPTPQPVYTGVSVTGNLATVMFNRKVCRPAASWSPLDWEITVNGVSGTFEDVADSITVCSAAGDNGVTSANLVLISSPPPGSSVAVTLTTTGGAAIRDKDGIAVSAPQTRIAVAAAPETTPPTIVSAAGNVGATTVTLTFSKPVYCTGLSFDGSDIVMTDNNPATVDPIVVGPGFDSCGLTQATADTSFSFIVNVALSPSRTYTVIVFAEANEIQDVFGNDLTNPSEVTFSTGAADVTPPTLVDTRLLNNVQSTDFGEPGDAFDATFSEAMNGTTTGGINVQDADGTTVVLSCGAQVMCSWNSAGTAVTVTVVSIVAPFGGTTPGLQLPATITTLVGFSDVAGNNPNLPGSPDRVIDNEFLTGPFAPPTVTDARVVNNVGTTDFSEIGDTFLSTFSAAMIVNGSARLLIQDQDGSLAMLNCGFNAICTWDTAATTLTVTIITPVAPMGGTIPGLQIPTYIRTLGGISDSSGNMPDLAGSADTLIDYE
jgi:hypothetical protein